MSNGVYIVSVDAKDLFLSNYSSPSSAEYSVKMTGADHNDQFNTKRFINTLDYSLDLIKLREVYEKVYRRMDFTFSKRGKEYCRRVINVTFKYSVKEFNRFFGNVYIKFGYLPQDIELVDNICMKDGELIAVRVDAPVENPISQQDLGDLFEFDNGTYRLGKTMKVLWPSFGSAFIKMALCVMGLHSADSNGRAAAAVLGNVCLLMNGFIRGCTAGSFVA